MAGYPGPSDVSDPTEGYLFSSPLLWAVLFVSPHLHAHGAFPYIQVKAISITQPPPGNLGPFPGVWLRHMHLLTPTGRKWVLQAKAKSMVLCADFIPMCPARE